MKRFTCAALALCLGSCASEGPFDLPPGASAKGAVTFRADGRAELDVEVGVNLAASGRARHFGLDGVRIEDFSGTPWTIDAVEFDEKDWPITAEDQDAERRVLRVRAHATPQRPNELGTQLIVELTGDEGPIDVFAGGVVKPGFDPCDEPTLGGVPETVGAPVAWVVPTLTGLVSSIVELEADDAGGVWMAAVSAATEPTSLMRLYRAVSTGLGSIQEVQATSARISTGADGSAVVTLGGNDFNAFELRRYDDAIDSLWKHDITSEAEPIAAVSGGRVAVALRTFDAVYVDGISVAPAPTSGAVLVVFDEVTGEFVTSAELLGEAAHLVRAGGGAFAVATASTVQVLEADLAERWKIDVSNPLVDLESTADGDVWIASAPSIFRVAPNGNVKHTYPLPTGDDIAPHVDGTVLIAGINALTRIDEGDVANRVPFPAPGAPWCTGSVAFRIAPTPDGAAFSFVRPAIETPFGAYLGKLTP